MHTPSHTAQSLLTHLRYVLATDGCKTPGDSAGYSIASWAITVHRYERQGLDYHSISLSRRGRNYLFVAIFSESYQLQPIVHYLSLPYVDDEYRVVIEFLRGLGVDTDYPKGHAFTDYPDGPRLSPHLSFRLPELFRHTFPTLKL